MKTAISVVLAFALALSAVPAVAGDTFQALRTLPAADQATLAPLPDDQLATVEGATLFNPLTISVNIAVLPQINVCAGCEDVGQENLGAISQIVTVQ
jgi:hypothetical protein